MASTVTAPHCSACHIAPEGLQQVIRHEFNMNHKMSSELYDKLIKAFWAGGTRKVRSVLESMPKEDIAVQPKGHIGVRLHARLIKLTEV
jgi:hypothetical protein